MTNIVKGMVSTYNNAWTHIPEFDEIENGQLKAMRAALQWLSQNVSDEMVQAAWEREFGRGGFDGDIWRKTIKSAIASAIRAAAGEEGE